MVTGRRLAAILLLCLPFAFCAAPGKPVAAGDPAARLQSIAHAAYEALWEFHPVDGTYAGFHKYDDRLCHYTPKRVAALAGKLRGWIAELAPIDTAQLVLDDQIDRDLLISNLREEIFRLEQLRLWQVNPKLYADECVQGVYYLLLRDFAPLHTRAAGVSRRLAEIPQVIAEARRNVKNPSAIFASSAIGELQDGEEFLAQSTRDLGERFPDLKPGLDANSQAAIQAMKSWRAELELALPNLRPEFAMGRANYDFLLRTSHFLPFGADSLLRIGENALARTDTLIRVLEEARAIREKQNPPVPEPVYPAPADFTKQTLFAYYADEIDSMRAWVANQGIATVPDYVGRLQVVETPTFLRRIIPGIAMEPPSPLDSVQTSYFYIPPIPDPLDSADRQRYYNLVRRRGWKGAVVHEGLPGHHLQLSIANHNPSYIRRMQGNTPLIEGWALYCEQMATEQGLYPDIGFLPLRWLGGVKFRAARIIVDVKLHTGQMSYDDAWRFMVNTFGGDTAFFQGEVRRYCLSPTQPMSYLVGKLQIMDLRRAYQSRMGDRYSLRDFHDRLLAEGSIPLSLIRRKLLAEQ